LSGVDSRKSVPVALAVRQTTMTGTGTGTSTFSTTDSAATTIIASMVSITTVKLRIVRPDVVAEVSRIVLGIESRTSVWRRVPPCHQQSKLFSEVDTFLEKEVRLSESFDELALIELEAVM
jgi:hypothetical protein